MSLESKGSGGVEVQANKATQCGALRCNARWLNQQEKARRRGAGGNVRRQNQKLKLQCTNHFQKHSTSMVNNR